MLVAGGEENLRKFESTGRQKHLGASDSGLRKETKILTYVTKSQPGLDVKFCHVVKIIATSHNENLPIHGGGGKHEDGAETREAAD